MVAQRLGTKISPKDVWIHTVWKEERKLTDVKLWIFRSKFFKKLKIRPLNVTANQSRQNYNIICQIHMENLFDWAFEIACFCRTYLNAGKRDDICDRLLNLPPLFFKSLKDFANYPMKENAKFSFKSRINSFNDLKICPKLPGLSDPFREEAKIWGVWYER